MAPQWLASLFISATRTALHCTDQSMQSSRHSGKDAADQNGPSSSYVSKAETTKVRPPLLQRSNTTKMRATATTADSQAQEQPQAIAVACRLRVQNFSMQAGRQRAGMRGSVQVSTESVCSRHPVPSPAPIICVDSLLSFDCDELRWWLETHIVPCRLFGSSNTGVVTPDSGGRRERGLLRSLSQDERRARREGGTRAAQTEEQRERATREESVSVPFRVQNLQSPNPDAASADRQGLRCVASVGLGDGGGGDGRGCCRDWSLRWRWLH